MATTSDASLLDLATKPQPEPSRVVVHLAVNVRSVSLAFIALATAVALMRWTEDFVVPVLLGVVLSYALTPLVDRLERTRVPRMAGAGLVLALILTAFGTGAYFLRGQAVALITSLPEVAKQIRQAAAGKPGDGEGTLAIVQRAANELQSSAKIGVSASAAASAGRPMPSSVAGVPTSGAAVQNAGINVRDYLLAGSLGVAAFAGQTLVVVFVALFLLGSGNTFRKKMVLLAGPTLTQRRVTVQALDEVHTQIQRYFLVQIVTSLLVGVRGRSIFHRASGGLMLVKGHSEAVRRPVQAKQLSLWDCCLGPVIGRSHLVFLSFLPCGHRVSSTTLLTSLSARTAQPAA